MRSVTKIFLPFLALTFLFGCGNHRDERQYDTNAAEVVDTPGDLKRGDAETNAQAAKRSPHDMQSARKAHPGENEIPGKKTDVKSSFATKAAEASQAEVVLGEMAIEKTKKNKVIGDFARMMIKDHKAANEELMKLAKEKGIDLPSECLSCEATYKSLHDLNTGEFEQQYAKKMVEDHEQAVKLFTEAAQNEQDPDLKKWAGEKLPTLKHHLAMAKQLAQEEHVSAKKSPAPEKKSKREKRKERKTVRS